MYVIIFLILAVAAMFHFIYQGILLPSYRLEMRIRLFALRDNLRRLKMENSNVDEEAFSCVQNAINCWVNRTGFDLYLFLKVHHAIEKDKQLAERIAKRAAAIENCSSPELKEIAKGVNQTLEKLIMLNSGPVFVYLFPLALAAACFRQTVNAVRRLACVSEWEMNRFTAGEAAT